MADDWVAVKLRGTVLQLVDGKWEKLGRGEAVPDSRAIRTMQGGRVTFERGAETIELGGNTQIQIFDKASRQPFTTVKQYFGEVAVEAEKKQVKHFAVQTPYLVAVVKGTRFVVRSDKGTSVVDVKRGSVSVDDRDDGSHTTVTAGQSAKVEEGETLKVAGRGELPAVLDKSGAVITEAKTKTAATSGTSKSAESDGDGKGNGKAKRDCGDSRAEGRKADDDAKGKGKRDGGDGNGKHGNDHSADRGNNNEKSDKGHGKSDDSNGNSGNGKEHGGGEGKSGPDHGNSDTGNSGHGKGSDGNSGGGDGSSDNGGGNGNGNSGNGNSGNGNGNGSGDGGNGNGNGNGDGGNGNGNGNGHNK